MTIFSVFIAVACLFIGATAGLAIAALILVNRGEADDA